MSEAPCEDDVKNHGNTGGKVASYGSKVKRRHCEYKAFQGTIFNPAENSEVEHLAKPGENMLAYFQEPALCLTGC